MLFDLGAFRCLYNTELKWEDSYRVSVERLPAFRNFLPKLPSGLKRGQPALLRLITRIFWLTATFHACLVTLVLHSPAVCYPAKSGPWEPCLCIPAFPSQLCQDAWVPHSPALLLLVPSRVRACLWKVLTGSWAEWTPVSEWRVRLSPCPPLSSPSPPSTLLTSDFLKLWPHRLWGRSLEIIALVAVLGTFSLQSVET